MAASGPGTGTDASGKSLKRLTDLRVVDLRAELEKRGLDKTGVKAQLFERLEAAMKVEGLNADEFLFETTEAAGRRMQPTRESSSAPATDASDEGRAAGDADMADQDEPMPMEEEEALEATDATATSDDVDAIFAMDLHVEEAEVEEEREIETGSGDEEKVPGPDQVEPQCPFTAEDTIALHKAAHPPGDETASAEDSVSMVVHPEDELMSEAQEPVSVPSHPHAATDTVAVENSSAEASSSGDVVEPESETKPSEEDAAPKKTPEQTKSAGSSGKSLWVTGLAPSTRAQDLKTMFSKNGRVMAAKIITSAKAPGSKCFGLITMASAEEAAKCIQNLHRKELRGRMISVERAKSDQFPLKKPLGSSPTNSPRRTVSHSSSKTHNSTPKQLPNEKKKDKDEGKDEIEAAEVGAKRRRKGSSERSAKGRSGREESEKHRRVRPPPPPVRIRASRTRGMGPRPLMSQHIAPPIRTRPGPIALSRPRGVTHSLSSGSFRGRPSALRPRTLLDRRREVNPRDDRKQLIEQMRQKEIQHKQREEELRLQKERERIRFEREKLEREKLELQQLRLTQQAVQQFNQYAAASSGFPAGGSNSGRRSLDAAAGPLPFFPPGGGSNEESRRHPFTEPRGSRRTRDSSSGEIRERDRGRDERSRERARGQRSSEERRHGAGARAGEVMDYGHRRGPPSAVSRHAGFSRNGRNRREAEPAGWARHSARDSGYLASGTSSRSAAQSGLQNWSGAQASASFATAVAPGTWARPAVSGGNLAPVSGGLWPSSVVGASADSNYGPADRFDAYKYGMGRRY